MPGTRDIPPISNTAFYCCGIREHDAQSRFPVLNDIYAGDFMTDEGRSVYEIYRPNHFEKGLNCVRAKIIDTLLAQRLRKNPGLKIVLIGAGFDSRAYRLAGGTWLEIDELAIIQHKNRCLPIDQCPNPLKRVPIDYKEDSLEEVLAENGTSHEYVYIVEGVFMYLEEKEIKATLKAIRAARPRHTLICDFMKRTFIRTYARGSMKRFGAMGAGIKCQSDRPEAPFLEHGYEILSEISVFEGAIQYGAVKLPKILMLPGMREGYRVLQFGMDGAS